MGLEIIWCSVMNRDITYWEVVIGRELCDIWVRTWCALQWDGTYPPIFLTCLTQDKSGRRLSPGKSIHHDFNSATVNKLNELGQNASAFMAQDDEKLKELQSTSKGLVFKPSTSKARKRKQNKRKGIKRKLARMENAKTRVLQKVLPRVKHDSQRWYDYWGGRRTFSLQQ